MKISFIIICFALMLPIVVTAQDIHWNATVEKIYIDNEKARIFVSNVSDSNPAGSVFGCTSNIITIGYFSDAISTSLKYSTAMEAYKSKITARIGVSGSGMGCTLSYIKI